MRSVVVVALTLFVAPAALAALGQAEPVALPPQSETVAAAGYAACAAAANIPKGMSCVPGGPAIVGSEKDKNSPRRIVELSTFYIDQNEVTNAGYQACVDAKVCKPIEPTSYSKKTAVSLTGPTQPAAPLDWTRAQAFCVWSGKRLPTEWEWEKAARGPNGDLWPWGNDAFSCDKAHAKECGDAKDAATKAVGSYAAGHYGLKDMAGNVAEWTSTWFTADTKACGPRCNGKDPRGPCDGANPCSKQPLMRAVRGGAWSQPQAQAEPAARRGEAVEAAARTGARCASTTTTLTTTPARLLTEKRPQPPAPKPPTPEQLKTFSSIKQDVLEKQVCAEKGRSFIDCRDPNHYIRSNEPRQHIWRPYFENIGGGYTGVGIDQNYSFIAHARSEWVWLFDYDPTVVRLHQALRAIILDSPDRKAFLAHFLPTAKDDVVLLLGKTYAGNPEAASYREVYTVARASLYSYYEHQMEGEVSVPDIVKIPGAKPEDPVRKAGVKVGEDSADPTFGWLATEESYQYIRLLHQQGRITILNGDMLAKDTMQGIGAAARALGVAIRVYYPSNAPECWPFTEQYKKNVIALPFDEKTVVIQTLSGIKTGFSRQIGYWHHNVQSGLQQQELLSLRGYGLLKHLIQERQPGPDPDLTTCGLAGTP